MNALYTKVWQWHDRFFGLISYAQSPFLLFVRIYWGWQLWQSGWGKLHNLDKVTEFFTGLNMLAPAQMALFIACVEFFGGILFALGAFSRITSLVLTVMTFRPRTNARLATISSNLNLSFGPMRGGPPAAMLRAKKPPPV